MHINHLGDSSPLHVIIKYKNVLLSSSKADQWYAKSLKLLAFGKQRLLLYKTDL